MGVAKVDSGRSVSPAGTDRQSEPQNEGRLSARPPGTVAVVIPTLNSARTLEACLLSLKRQTVRPHEVIIVDDVKTTDDTRAIAARMGARVIISPAGMAESRNLGFAEATSSYFLSIDSDMMLSPEVIAELVRVFDGHEADAVTIPEVGVGAGLWAKGRILDKASVEHCGFGRSLRAYRRGFFATTGGYDPAQEAFEDFDFHRRVLAAGAVVKHLDSAYIEHDEGSVRFLDAVRKKYRYGFTVPAFEDRHGAQPFLAGLPRRILSAVVIGARHDPLSVPVYLVLKAAEYVAASGSSSEIASHTRWMAGVSSSGSGTRRERSSSGRSIISVHSASSSGRSNPMMRDDDRRDSTDRKDLASSVSEGPGLPHSNA